MRVQGQNGLPFARSAAQEDSTSFENLISVTIPGDEEVGCEEGVGSEGERPRVEEEGTNVEAFCATAIVIMCYHGSGLITFDSYVIDWMTPNR